jgi:hypothetical protein
LRELVAQVLELRTSAHEHPGGILFPPGQPRGFDHHRSLPLRQRDPPGYAVGEDVLEQSQRRTLRLQIELFAEDVSANVELAYGLVAKAELGVASDQPAMDVLPPRILLEYLPKAVGRPAVGTTLLQLFREAEQQANVQFREEVAPLRAPAFVTVLGKELAAVGAKRGLVRGDIAASECTLGQPLEAVGVDLDQLRVQRQHAVDQAEVRGAASRQQLRLERTACRVESLGKAVQRRLELDAGPEDLQDLLTVKRMTRMRRKQLCQPFRAASLPAANRQPRCVDRLDSEAAEELHSKRARRLVADGGADRSNDGVCALHVRARSHRRRRGSHAAAPTPAPDAHLLDFIVPLRSSSQPAPARSRCRRLL